MGTLKLGSFDGGAVQFEVDYNDSNRRVQRVRCFNQGTGNARAMLIEPVTREIVVQAVFPPGQTTTISVAAGQVTIDAVEGADLPYDTLVQYPVS